MYIVRLCLVDGSDELCFYNRAVTHPVEDVTVASQYIDSDIPNPQIIGEVPDNLNIEYVQHILDTQIGEEAVKNLGGYLYPAWVDYAEFIG
jgi:hypothetical protein